MEKLRSKTVLMVMMDAFRHDYITKEDSPFLYKLSREGMHGSLIPSFGFEPDGAYFAGLDPEECDGGAQYWKKENERVFYFTSILNVLDRIPFPWWRKQLRHVARFSAQLLASSEDTFISRMAPPSDIPFNKLGQFSFSMKKLACDEGFMPKPSIFDKLRDKGMRFFFHGHPAYKVRIGKVVERYLEEEHGGNALAFLFIGDLDRVGHAYGPDSSERKAMLREIDSGLEKIYSHAQRNYNDIDIIVFGDHGMADVKQTIDMRNIIDKLNLDNKKDTYFLDSTFARFWIADPLKKEEIINHLNSLDGGHVLTDSEKEKYRIRYPHNYFGDIIYVIDDHYLIHPSFYGAGEYYPKGMHGYLPGCRDNESAFVLHGKRVIGKGDHGRIDMRKIFPTILDLLEIDYGNEMPHNLKSIIK